MFTDFHKIIDTQAVTTFIIAYFPNLVSAVVLVVVFCIANKKICIQQGAAMPSKLDIRLESGSPESKKGPALNAETPVVSW